MSEPTISVNGTQLTNSQAMTVRVALGAFLIDLADADALGDDEHGRAMTRGYKARLAEIFRMFTPAG